MRKVGKPVFFIVVILILALTYTSFMGIKGKYGDVSRTYIKGGEDIRWGIDIRGGADVTFSPPEGTDATDEDMAAAEQIIKIRLVSQNITDSEVYTDYDKNRIVVRFPWKVGEVDFDPQQAVAELGETAMLTFREGADIGTDNKPKGDTLDKIVITGKNIVKAEPMVETQTNKIFVSLELDAEGAASFAEATGRLATSNGKISIWLDDTLISAPTVNSAIPDGKAMIEGNFTAKEAKGLADKINAGALPFKLISDNFNSISPTLGLAAKDAMVMAGAIAFGLVAIFITVLYRLPGAIAVIALMGQVAGSVAAISGYFPVIPSFTLTLPGIAGVILAIGIGVDANIITAERVREELNNGKSIDSALDAGFKRAFTAIFDGNVTVIIVAIILMGAFGPPTSIFSAMLKPVFFLFGPSTAGAIYSFGYTLLVGVLLNFVMGIFASRLMLKSISRFKPFRKAWLYGGVR